MNVRISNYLSSNFTDTNSRQINNRRLFLTILFFDHRRTSHQRRLLDSFSYIIHFGRIQIRRSWTSVAFILILLMEDQAIEPSRNLCFQNKLPEFRQKNCLCTVKCPRLCIGVRQENRDLTIAPAVIYTILSIC